MAKRSDEQRPPSKKAHFIVNAALLEELGERLVSKPEVALAELIKNAYDADSSSCIIDIGPAQISVTDTGHGMTEGEFQHNWMVVSAQEKGRLRFSRTFHRSMAGSKGIGRFSARYLGNVLELITVADDPNSHQRTRLKATFPWSEISRRHKIEEITIYYTVEKVAPSVPTGTTLRITDLRPESKRIISATVKTDILRLTDPAGGLERPPFSGRRATVDRPQKDPGFTVTFVGETLGNESDVTPDIVSKILAAYVGRVRLEVKESGLLTYKVFWRDHELPLEQRSLQLKDLVAGFTATELLATADGEAKDSRGFPKAVESIKYLPLSDTLHSPVFIDLRYFPRRQGTFSNLEVNGTVAQAWLHGRASVSIIDNSFAMATYADVDSDWLALDASKARSERTWQSIFSSAVHPMKPADRQDPARNPMLALPSSSQLIGCVHIATRKRPASEGQADEWLQPNMDRESLRANEAFNTLWHIARFATELLAHFDRKIRLQKKDKENRERRKLAKEGIREAILEIRSSSQIDPEYRHQLASQLEAVETQLAEASEYEKEARVSLELMSMMGVMAGFMTHEFEKAMSTLRQAAAAIRRIASAKPELADAAAEVLKSEQYLSHYLDYMRLFSNKARHHAPQAFKAAAQIKLVVKTLSAIADDHEIKIDVDVDSRLPGPLVPLAAYNGIVMNLVSNAMKALVPRTGPEERNVRIYAYNEDEKHFLVCSDNGIGIPTYLRTRIWDPLFTTTDDEDNPLGSGLGLGLSVVQQVTRRLGGKIELLDQAAPGFITAFRVALPLSEAGT